MKKTIPVTTDSKINQPTNLVKEVKDLHNENFKPLMTKSAEDTGKWKDRSHSHTGGIKQCTKSMQPPRMLILFTEIENQSHNSYGSLSNPEQRAMLSHIIEIQKQKQNGTSTRTHRTSLDAVESSIEVLLDNQK